MTDNLEIRTTKIENPLKIELKERITREMLMPDFGVPGSFISIPKRDDKYKFFNPNKFLSPNNWVYHEEIVDKVLVGDYKDIMPYSAELVATMNCTNRCKIPCSYMIQKMIEDDWLQNNFKVPRIHMQDEGFGKMLIDKLLVGGVKGIIFTGGGEPFLFRGVENLIAYCTSNGADVTFYTNGNSVSEARIEKVIEAKPLLGRVSLNCGTKEVYNQFHAPSNPHNAFENTLRTIKALAKGSLSNPNMGVGIGVVINEINKDDLVETGLRIREIVEETGGGIEFIAYRPAYNYNAGQQLESNFLDEAYEVVETKVREVLKGTNVRVANIKCRYDALKEEDRGYVKCRASGLYAEVSPSGETHICCDRNCHRAYSFGDLSKQSLAEIWQSERRIAMIDEIDFYKCRLCPPSCKPHETNKQFEVIEQLRANNEMHKVEVWIEEQRKMQVPKMVNF
jgi:MoaA/NifB/PqqE/SkfB family radical SAM enzyme